MIENQLERIATALEALVQQNAGALATVTTQAPSASPTAVTETPAPAAAEEKLATGKGKGGKAKQEPAKETPAPAPTPEPEPEPAATVEDEGPEVSAADCRKAFLELSQKLGEARQSEAKKTFDDYRTKIGVPKLEEMSNAQRSELLGLFKAQSEAADM